MNNAEVLIKFTGDTSSADNAVKKQEDNLDSLKKKGENTIMGLTAAVDAFAAVILKTGIEYNAQVETYLTRLTTLTGSAKDANAVLEQIKKDALATPFEVSSLTQAESLLLATGLSAEDARADVLALGDALAASGGGNAELSRMAVNMQQIRNVGKATALDIKQFAYAGIDIYGLLADSMEITRAEAADLDVTYEMLSEALQKASKEGGKYYGAMEAQSKTYKGAMSNLGESVQVLAGTLSEGLFEAIKGIIPPLTDLFNWLAKNKTLVTAIMVPLLTFLNVLAGFLIINKTIGLFKGLWAIIAAHPFFLIIAVIAALVAGFVYLWNNCEGFRNFFIAMWEGIKTVVGAVVNFIQERFVATVSAVANAWNKMKAGAMVAWNGIKNTFSTVATFFRNIFTNAWNAVKAVFSTGGKIFDGIKDGIVNAFKTIVNGIIGGINKVVAIPFNAINKVLKKLKGISIAGIEPFSWVHTFEVPQIPKLATGTNMVPKDMLAMIHKGEAVVPKKFNPYANGINNSTFGGLSSTRQRPIINVYANFETDPIGQVVSKIKTYSGGAKNDYNYGYGG